MKQILKYIRIILSYIYGLLLCVVYSLLPKRRLVSRESGPRVIVSLTSYGRRVTGTLKYPVYSMLLQSRRPDRIVVWLDNVCFSEDFLPASVKRLEKYGVEIRFCEDLKSYKKLVPALKEYPDDIIITIDDDIIYERNTLKCLLDKHNDYPDDIICTMAHIPTFGADGLKPYNDWKLNVCYSEEDLIFPLGGSGTLYPPHSLYKDVTDASLFMKLAPQADDIWFWVMALKNGRSIRMSGLNRMYRQIDLMYQQTHRNSSLKDSNLGENRNDTQIKAVFDYYGLNLDKSSVLAMISARQG